MTDNQENSKYQCPRCHSENIQSYSLIHSMGISKIDLSTVGVGYSNNLGVGRAKSHGTQQTAMSASTAPPKKRSPAGDFFGSWLVFSIPGVICKYLNFHYLIVNILVWGAVILAFFMARDAYQWNKYTFPQKLRDWEHSYVCLRCGNRFIL